MAKRKVEKVQFKIDSRVLDSDVVDGLEKLMAEAANAIDLKDIFSNAMLLMYQLMPEGKKNYGKLKIRGTKRDLKARKYKPRLYKSDPRIGEIYTVESTYQPEVIDVVYRCSGYYNDRRLWAFDIAYINLRTRTAYLEWKPGDFHAKKDSDYPNRLRRDSEYLFTRLGLKLSGPRVSDD